MTVGFVDPGDGNRARQSSIDSFSDEGQFQIQHDQLRPSLNRGLSDFHRKHRLISSSTWDLPFKGGRLLNGCRSAASARSNRGGRSR